MGYIRTGVLFHKLLQELANPPLLPMVATALLTRVISQPVPGLQARLVNHVVLTSAALLNLPLLAPKRNTLASIRHRTSVTPHLHLVLNTHQFPVLVVQIFNLPVFTHAPLVELFAHCRRTASVVVQCRIRLIIK